MAIFHLDVKTGTRGGGQSASAKFDYLGREGRYSKEAEELEYVESGNMPAWAEDDPGKYWQAADEHERVNGRLFQQVEVALPVELDERQRRDLARSGFPIRSPSTGARRRTPATRTTPTRT